MSQTTYFVRLCPYNKRRGFLARNYTYQGQRFSSRWVRVSAMRAKELGELTQPHDTEIDIPLFEIKTESEALDLEQRARDNGEKITARVKDAPVVPDSAFRDDRPKVNLETGAIEEPSIEPAETVEKVSKIEEADFKDDDDVAPAPSIRSGKARSRK